MFTWYFIALLVSVGGAFWGGKLALSSERAWAKWGYPMLMCQGLMVVWGLVSAAHNMHTSTADINLMPIFQFFGGIIVGFFPALCAAYMGHQYREKDDMEYLQMVSAATLTGFTLTLVGLWKLAVELHVF